MPDVRVLAREYLAEFSRRDLASLEARFSPNVSLRDWDVGLVQGRAAVLAVNRKIFESVGSIEARPLAIYADGHTAVAELEVHVDGKLALLVTDVLEFDEAGRIKAVRAYRGS